MNLLQSFFANIPYDIQIKHEKYYQTIFFVLFKLIGLNIEAESRTNNGRIDAVCHYKDHIFIFEFKLNSKVEIAIEQIKQKEYYKKYEHLTNKTITLIGANFSFKTGQIEEFIII